MTGGAGIKKGLTKSSLAGAGLTALVGLLLWGTMLGDPWVNASYDLLFRFGTRGVTNQVVLIEMDNAACRALGQTRELWNRALHAQLLNQLAKASCPLVVFDLFFDEPRDAPTDNLLAAAMRRHGNVVLKAEVQTPARPGTETIEVALPRKLFLEAATKWGLGEVKLSDDQPNKPVRRHWPFPAPVSGFPSLPWTAALLAGAPPDKLPQEEHPQEQWLRYYGPRGGGWETFSYHLAMSALSNGPDSFRGKTVFIGNKPDISDTNSTRLDTFRTPYGEDVGGMEILAVTFLNLINGDWLRRLPAWSEAALLVLAGVLIGGGLCQLKPFLSGLAAAGIALGTMLVFVSWSYYSNYWFPWLVIAGGQVPCALAWAWASGKRPVVVIHERFPGFATVGGPLGKGAYGKVWLVRDALGHFQALKEIERANFKDGTAYEREFRGIKSYKPVSNLHPSLLHIDYVNRNDQQGYFYYVMELGDPLDPDWQQKGEPYKPRDLASVCHQAAEGRLLPLECIRIGIKLLEPLHFLHQQGLAHRDIKPSNIVLVNGKPKLADIGLMREATSDGTVVGTLPYMPPPPEPPGTQLADIYAMGKMLYVISTGKDPQSFAEISTALVKDAEFMRLNVIICKACQPEARQRYASAAEMLAALRAAQKELDAGHTRII
ncbi:MAG: CHASE2 domain-containing protein [Limisphaerales bacterium]